MAARENAAPGALLFAQASDPQECDVLRAAADSVFLRHHTPEIVADALLALSLETSRGAGTWALAEGSLP